MPGIEWPAAGARLWCADWEGVAWRVEVGGDMRDERCDHCDHCDGRDGRDGSGKLVAVGMNGLGAPGWIGQGTSKLVWTTCLEC